MNSPKSSNRDRSSKLLPQHQAFLASWSLTPRRGWTSLKDTEAPAGHTSRGECGRERGTDGHPVPGRCSWQLLQPGGGKQVLRAVRLMSFFKMADSSVASTTARNMGCHPVKAVRAARLCPPGGSAVTAGHSGAQTNRFGPDRNETNPSGFPRPTVNNDRPDGRSGC
jgi:hypothetical protein